MMKTNSGASAAALSGLALVLLLGACATATDAPASAAALPAAYIESDPAGHAAPATDGWRGFGSAELSALSDAALAALNGAVIAGRTVVAEIARPRRRGGDGPTTEEPSAD